MNRYQLIAGIAWTTLQLSLIGLIAGLLAQHRGRRTLALSLLLISVFGTLGFSLVGRFSIGRFTAVIAVLAIGDAVAMGRGPAAVAGGVLAAAVTYVAFSWLMITPLVGVASPLVLLFGFWGIPFYAILAVAAFAWAFAKRPSARNEAC